ncbi:MAG: succinylglutamate desuccinylase/aspartoacylase family protein [Verrucomicrobia bacterium]|nr:succinylglutamate desuccinylase/aspartoacylase family protein [Verrucomicrobiota bacterium]
MTTIQHSKHQALAKTFILLFTVALMFGQSAVAQVKVAVQEKRTWEFKDAGIRFNNDFPGARLNECSQVGSNQFRILILPENAPVNNSPWFAFQVVAKRPTTVTVTLAYEKGKHRYHPKISHDGKTWTMLGANAYHRDREKNEAALTFKVGPKPVWIAAQEMIGGKELTAWMNGLSKRKFVEKSLVGKSMQGRAIEQLEIGSGSSSNYVFIIGRQHPPEVTGSFGLMSFTETIAGNSSVAQNFRKHFSTIVIPLLNPDGVEHGHWRHNMGGVDLNRDWNKFDQPETTLVRDHLVKIGSPTGARVFLMLDFHSTGNDIFYTQTDAQKTFPEDFTKNWLAAIQGRFPDYKVVRSGSHDPRGNTSKVWGFMQFGAACITYELGDNTDRKRIRQITSGAAEEMMKMFLAEIGERN